MRTRLAILLATGVILTGGRWAVADTPAIDKTSPQAKAIVQTTQAMAKAFNQGDARGLAALWSEDGVCHSHETGERLKGRAAIEKDYSAHFRHIKGARLEVTIDALRLVTTDVAMLDGSAHVQLPGDLPKARRFAMVLVNKDGRWLIDSVREVDLPSPPSNYDHLKELDWMVGDWIHRGDDYEVRTACEWVANNNFLARRFTVSREDKIELQGTQIVGWDARQNRLRSWFFDSDGSFGEGPWKHDGNRWVIQATGILPSGKKASATQIITRVDNDKYTWQVIGRYVGGVPQPNVEPVNMVRQQSATAAKRKEQAP